MTNLKNRTIAGAAALIATIVTVGAAAPLRAEPVSRTVSYHDLDLSTEAGHAALSRRVRHAVNQVCGPIDLATRQAVLDCRRQAAATAAMNVRLATVQAGTIQLAAAR